MSINWFKYSSPASFYPLAGKLRPWFLAAAAILFPLALYQGFVVAPTDAQQGESYRILFIHVATATLSMLLYLVMAGYCALTLIFNTRLSAMMAQALAPTGAWFTFIALWTGALWGKPTWGTYWVWDARITSELILLFLYLGYMALSQAIDDVRRADRAGALVEHPAPGGVYHRDRRAEDGAGDAAGVAVHDARLLGLRICHGHAARSLHHPRTRSRQPVGRRPAGTQRTLGNTLMEWWKFNGYAFYVWGSYLAAFTVVAIEMVLLRARRMRALRNIEEQAEPQ